MSDPNVTSSRSASAVQASLESPAPDQKIYDEAVFLSGWVYAPGREPASCQVRAYLDDCCLAETRILSYRADVCEKLALSPDVLTGFRMLGKIQPAAAESREHKATLRLVASWDDGVSHTLVEQLVLLVPALLRARPYGEVVYPENETPLHRENIYGSGPPIEGPGIEVSNLLREYLPERSSVVDVGCGAGAFGPGLMAAGHHWLGLEANSHCCDILLRRQLPFRRVHPESGALPCADGEWDCAIAIEVLEHVRDPEMFLREITRVIRGRALLSVPNMEVLPYFHDWRVVPWHLLEGDHKNFFTRANLRNLLGRFFRRVEVFSYGEHPLPTREGVPLHQHLFAVAEN